MLKGLLFDLDGVITDTAGYHYQAWKQIAEEIGIVITPQFNEQLKGISREESLNRILYFGKRDTKFSEKEKALLRDKKNMMYLELIDKITPEDILPKIDLLLEEATQNNIKLAVASASNNGPLILKKLGLEDTFDIVVDPDKVENGKPFPDIFIKATEMLSLKNHEVVGIEDSSAGVQSINAADIFSIGIGSKDSLKDADFIVNKTSDLSLEIILEQFNLYQNDQYINKQSNF